MTAIIMGIGKISQPYLLYTLIHFFVSSIPGLGTADRLNGNWAYNNLVVINKDRVEISQKKNSGTKKNLPW